MTGLDPKHYRSALDILSQGSEITLSTIRVSGAPHASTVHFANDGFEIYAAISIDSQKAHDIRHDPRVALTVNLPYHDWSEIRGLSIDARAAMVVEPSDLARASQLLLAKYPQYAEIVADTSHLPWPGMLFTRISPVTIALLDYTQGFGHTEHFEL